MTAKILSKLEIYQNEGERVFTISMPRDHQKSELNSPLATKLLKRMTSQ